MVFQQPMGGYLCGHGHHRVENPIARKSIKCIPVGILISGFLTTHFFWFTESFRTTAILDALGIIISFTAYWVCAQYSRKASYWLLPWAIWMPITFALKIAALNGLFG